MAAKKKFPPKKAAKKAPPPMPMMGAPTGAPGAMPFKSGGKVKKGC